MDINKIAELAGVSRATVSRFLNKGYVSSANKEKIQKVIDETGYVPSLHAQTLRTKKTNLIGVILPKIASETISRIVEGISIKLNENGYNVLLGNTDNTIEKELEYLKIFKNNRVDGIIFIGTIITPAHKKIMKQIKVPIVMLGQKIEGYPCVYHDDYGATFQLVSYLIERGCKKIAYIGVTTEDKAAGLARKNAYLDVLEQAGLEVNSRLIKEGKFSFESGYDNMKILLDEYEQDIDGVYCATDTIATGALYCLKERGIPVPQKIKIAGIGDSRISKLIEPSLTSVHYYYKTSGIEAASLMLDKLSEDSSRDELKLGFEIYPRSSTS